MKYLYWIYVLFAVFCFSCDLETNTIEQELLDKCIDAHGGLENWNNLPKLTYSKKITLYTESKTIEKEIFQLHNYNYKEGISGSIEWKDSLDHKITFKGGQAFKTNGKIDEEPNQSSLNTFNSAFYVLNMPWKLKDKSAILSYQGIDTILDNKIVHTLKIEYPNEVKQDIWEYYLDYEDYHLIANMVHHGSTYSLITNDAFVWHKELMWNSNRTSYMVDSLGQVLYQRAKYEYTYHE